MIEIFIDFNEIENKTIVETEVKILTKNNWSKFGNNGSVLLFKNITIDEANKELKKLGIKNLEAEETDYSFF